MSDMDFPAAPKSRVRSSARVAATVAFVSLCAVDLAVAASFDGSGVFVVAVVLAVGLTAVALPPHRWPGWLTNRVRTVVPAAVSGVVSLLALVVAPPPLSSSGPAEALILLYLLAVAVRTGPPVHSTSAAVLGAVALLALPVRTYAARGGSAGLVGLEAALVLLTAGAVGLGGYLRFRDSRRRLAVAAIRRTERLAIAADLHDFVAHHVTAILLQTQMARVLAGTEPARLDPVLAEIEQAAAEALESMRHTVGILRSGTGPGHPVGDFTQLGDLVDGFARRGPARITLVQDEPVPPDVPPEVQATAYRVVQEALTNVSRHAADATEVEVVLRRAGDALVISVRDDGRGATASPVAARGGGFGLVGLTERADALGGTLRAGPRTGGGWETVAVVPLRRTTAVVAGSTS